MIRIVFAIIWVGIGALLTHMAYYLYVILLAADQASGMARQIALAVQASLPIITASAAAAVWAVPWVIVLIFVGVGTVFFLRRRRDITIGQTLLNAEEVYREAQKELRHYQEMIKEAETALNTKEKKLKAKYARMENELKTEYARLKAPYTDEIKRLKNERIELRETVAKLMNMLKQKKKN